MLYNKETPVLNNYSKLLSIILLSQIIDWKEKLITKIIYIYMCLFFLYFNVIKLLYKCYSRGQTN